MKITMYELLGMIKDGKAPKKIKYINSIWKYDKETKDYFHNDLWLIYSMNSIGLIEREVEILEEEKKISEKWNDLSFTTMKKREDSIDDDIQKLKGYIETIMRTQNEIIDYLKSKGDE